MKPKRAMPHGSGPKTGLPLKCTGGSGDAVPGGPAAEFDLHHSLSLEVAGKYKPYGPGANSPSLVESISIAPGA